MSKKKKLPYTAKVPRSLRSVRKGVRAGDRIYSKFDQFDRDLMARTDLTPAEKIVITAIENRNNKWDFNISGLSKLVGLPVTTLRDVINNLKEKGLLVWDIGRDENGCWYLIDLYTKNPEDKKRVPPKMIREINQ